MSIKIVMKDKKLDDTKTVKMSRSFKLDRTPTNEEPKKPISFPPNMKVAEPVELWHEKIA